MSAGGYKTRQKDAITEYFTERGEEHVTAAEIVDHLRTQGMKIAPSTVYRCLERLENEGFLRKYIIDEGSAACWQHLAMSGDCENHFHLKCTVCGRLIHADCSYLSTLSAHVQRHHGFVIDNLKTVLYGVCSDCAGIKREVR